MAGSPPKDCDLCPDLVKSRSCIVQGRGPIPASIMLIGQGPGVEENEQGKCFIGRSGQLLRLLCDAAGIPINEVYLDNVTRCHAVGNRRPKTKEVTACRPFILYSIKKVQPDVIVTLGDVALQGVIGAKNMTLGSVVGQTIEQPETGIPVVPTYHPAFMLRGNWNFADLVIAHLEKASAIAEVGEYIWEQGLGEYATIGSIEGLEALRDYLVSLDCFSWDTETVGLSWQGDELLGISFSGASGEGFMVPIYVAPDLVSYWGDDEPEVIKILQEIFSSSAIKVAHNAIFDIRMLERSRKMPTVEARSAFGIKVGGKVEDTMLLHHSLYESLPHSLTSIAALNTTLPYYENAVREQSSNKRKMVDVDPEALWEYGAADADAVMRVRDTLLPKAQEEGVDWALDNIMYPLIRFCWAMEQRGMLIDQEYFDKLCTHYSSRIAEKEAELFEIYGEPFKYGSYKPLQKVLFQDLGLPSSGRRTPSGRGCEACKAGLCFEHEATGKDALQEVYELCQHPIIPVLLELKSLMKLNSTYLDGGQGGFRRYIESDGRIRASYRPGGTETSRLTATEPPVQTIPGGVKIPELDTKDAFRRMVIAPEGKGIITCLVPGTKILMADLSERPVETLRQGDEVVAIEEKIPRRWGRRHMQTAHVTNIAPRKADLYTVIFGEANSICASGDHRWLVWRNKGYCWRSTKQLRFGDRLLRAPEMGKMEPEDASYLAGFLDGEGWVQNRDRVGCTLGFGQRPGLVLDKVLTLLRKYGFNPKKYKYTGGALGKGDVQRYAITSAFEVIRLLSVARSVRLLEKFSGGRETYEEREPCTARDIPSWYTVKDVIPQGHGLVVALETDKHTFVANGAFHHNCDWGQAELWGLAYLAPDERLLQILMAGEDVHVFAARQIWPDVDPDLKDFEWKAAHKDLRRRAKTFTFGLQYGLTAEGVADRQHTDVEEAKELIERYMKAIPGLPNYMRRCRQQILELGYLENIWGQRRHFPGATILRSMGRGAHNDLAAMIREGINYPIQSSISGLHSLASFLTEGSEALKARGVGAILSLHDSLVLEFDWPDDDYAHQTAWMIKEMWENLARECTLPSGEKLGWGIPVEAEYGSSWGSPRWRLTADGSIIDLEEIEDND